MVSTVRFGIILSATFTVSSGYAISQAMAPAQDATQAFANHNDAIVADAVECGNTAKIHDSFRRGADPSASGARGVSLLEWAIVKDEPASFEALLSEGADVTHVNASGNAAIHVAAMSSDGAFLAALVARHVDVNTPNPVTGATPIISAIYAGRTDRLRELLIAGANPSLVDHGGNSALHVAAMSNDYGEMLALLDAGANPFATNRRGVTFQRFAAMTPPTLLNDNAKQERARVDAWLTVHGAATIGG